jgi:hypothetical protein
MKYVARVKQVLKTGIHMLGAIEGDKVVPLAELPLPTRVEIELEGGPNEACMMFRYNDADEFCGDTWHENLAQAFDQARFEYGLSEPDFSVAGETHH